VAFPWADDLLGKFLRKLRVDRQKQKPKLKQEPKQQEQQQQQAQQQPLQQQQELHPGTVKQECQGRQQELTGHDLQGSQQHHGAGGGQGGRLFGSINGSCKGSAEECEAGGGGQGLQGNGTRGACEGLHCKSHLFNG